MVESLRRQSRMAGFCGLVIVAVLAAAALAQAQLPWSLAWHDEFSGASGSAPNSGNWTYDTGAGGWGNAELETYCAAGSNISPCNSSTPNAYLDGNGHLVIAVLNPSPNVYTSTRMKSQGLQHFTYGRIEARVQIPYGKGLWPAFWMLGEDISSVSWPACGEIDILESIGADPGSSSSEPYTVHGSLHGPVSPGSSNAYSLTGTYQNASQLSTGYHVYAIEWSPAVVNFYIDGILYESRSPLDLSSGNVWEFDPASNPFFVILNTAVGGYWPGNPDSQTTFPQYMNVDYVRVYQVAPTNLPADWGNYDDGGPSQPGSANYSSGTYTVAGSGTDIWNNADQFQYAYTAMSGNGQIVAHVASQGNTNAWAKAGVMLRESTNAGASFADVVLTPGNGVHMEYRNGTGNSASDIAGSGSPAWLKLVRSGSSLTGYSSTDGTNWTQIGSASISMQNDLLVGLAVTSHDNTQTSTATFDNVSITQSVAAWNGTPAPLPGRVEAENYDDGGAGWAYHDSDATNNGGQYRPQNGVDIERTTDVDDGYDVGWTEAGEWLNYTVNVQQAGTYTLNVRVASNGQGGTFHFNLDGSQLSNTFTVPNTGGWQNWTTLSQTGVYLSAGTHLIGLAMDSNGTTGSVGNFNWFSFQ